MWIGGDDTTGNVVVGNLIGTNALGQAAIANNIGVRISHNAKGNLIGGSSPLARNIISGNTTYGVLIEGALTTNNTVQGNYIGTDRSGSLALGNTQGGVEIISGANGNYLIGNVISGNAGGGVRITGSTGNTLLGNRIGTDAAGLRACLTADQARSVTAFRSMAPTAISSVDWLMAIAMSSRATVAMA